MDNIKIKWFKAFQNLHIKRVRRLLEIDSSVLNLQYNGYTALMYASFRGRKEVVDFLIGAGANLDLKSNDGKTALMEASCYGHKETVDSLIKAGANLDLKSNGGKTALMQASYIGYKEIVDLLIKAGANLNLKDNTGWAALMHASSRGHKEIFYSLIEADANIYTEDNYQRTCLHLYLHNNNIELTEYLLNQGLAFGTDKHISYMYINQKTHNYFQDYEGYREYQMINEQN